MTFSQAGYLTLQSVKGYLKSLSEPAERFNAEPPALIRDAVVNLKQRLLDAAGMTAALGLPIKRRSGVPTTYAVPVRLTAPDRIATCQRAIQARTRPING
jgi:hypothetical protein